MKTMKHTPLYLAVAAGIVIGLLFARASLVALLPWVFILLCPVMMLLMMRGMGHGADHDATDQPPDRPIPPPEQVGGGR